MSDPQTASPIGKSIDASRIVAKRCVKLAFLLRLFVESGVVAKKDPNVPSDVARVIADLGMALGGTSVFSTVEHWITPRKPVKFATVQASSVHAVALELANRIHQAAVRAIELVHSENTLKTFQQQPEGTWQCENHRGGNVACVQTREYSPFIITYQTTFSELLEAWHLETWDVVRYSLNRYPVFDEERLQAMIDCEHADARRRLACWSIRNNRHAIDDELQRGTTSAKELQQESAVRMGTTWKEPVYVRGRKKFFQKHAQFKVIAALKEAGSEGLSKDALEAVATDARKILSLLRQDPDWASVIQMAEKKGNRYRLLDRTRTP